MQDWAKPGPYDQPMVNTLRRSKDRRDTTDPSSHQGSVVTTPVEDQQGIKGNHTVMSSKVSLRKKKNIQRQNLKAKDANLDDVLLPPLQGEKEAHEELARALARGLQLDIHGSSRDSLQGSSGYSSQTNTPCCSEDTIPSQGACTHATDTMRQ